MFGAGAFIQRATNMLAHHLFGKAAIRPSRRALPSAARNEKPDTSDRRHKQHARKLERTRSRIGGPASKKAAHIKRLQRETTIDFLLRKQRDAWRRLGPQDAESALVWKHMDALEFDRMKTTAIFRQQEVSDRVKAEAGLRRKAMARRDTRAKQILQMRAFAEELRQEKIQQAAKEYAQREAFDRLIKEREEAELREAEAREAAEREKRRLFQQQMRERAEQLSRERAEQEARDKAEQVRKRAQQQQERRQKMEQERVQREERHRELREEQQKERIRVETLRKLREAAHDRNVTDDQLQEYLANRFTLYEKKWDALKATVDIDGSQIVRLTFSEIPWPIMILDPTGLDALTVEAVKEFMFHPMRPGSEGKTERGIIRSEMMKWHPDKFNSMVLAKVREEEKELVTAAGGEVARHFTAILNAL